MSAPVRLWYVVKSSYRPRNSVLATESNKSHKTRLSPFIAALFVLFALDTLLFRSYFYERFIKFDSSAGIYRYRRTLLSKRAKDTSRLISVVGDSRMAEGFSAKTFDQIAASSPYRALNLAVPGSSLRVWYYLLSQADPTRKAFKLIVIPMCSFSDHDEGELFSNRLLDLQFLMPYLSVNDSIECLQTYSEFEPRMDVLLATVFKLYAYRFDVRDFVLNPAGRLQDIDLCNKYNDYSYTGHEESLRTYLDKHSHHAHLNSAQESAMERLNKCVTAPIANQTGDKLRYNRLWMNRIIDAYHDTDTILMFVKIPAGPVSQFHEAPKVYSNIELVSHKPNVLVAPEHMFDDLQSPDYFFDDLHLNARGRQIFSKRLSEAILQKLQYDSSLADRNISTKTH
jgi:hypothetical protein